MSTVIELNGSGLNGFLSKNPLAVVNFYRVGCRHCAIMEPIYHRMAAEHGGVAFAQVDVVGNRDIARSLDIIATPTFVAYRHGVREAIWEGDFPEEEFRIKLAKLTKGA